MENNDKRIYRLAPYSVYEYDRIEKYLEEMAQKGYFFESVFCGVMSFKIDKPQKARYRLEAIDKKRDENDDMDFYEECGWIKLDSWREFRVWCTLDENAREIDTDDEVKALSLKNLKKSLVSNYSMLIFWLIAYPIIKGFGTVLLSIIEIGTIVSSIGIFFILCDIFYSGKRIIYLSKRIKAIKNDEEIKVKENSRARQIIACVLIVAVIVWGFFFADRALKHMVDEYEMPYSEYKGELPFADISKLVENGKLEKVTIMNTVSVREDILAPKIIYLDQSGRVTSDTAESFSGGLHIQYYELKNEFLAKMVFDELCIHDRKSKRYKDKEEPDLNVDEIKYHFEVFDTLIIRKGEKVARIVFYETGEPKLNVSYWGKIIADSIS